MAGDDIAFELDDAERRFAQSIIDARTPGKYTLRKLFGKDEWLEDNLGDVRNYGLRFWQSVRKKQLRRISGDGHKSGSRVYSIHPKGWQWRA